MPDPNCSGCFINHFQTNEWRRAKYWLARSLGISSHWAAVWRDRRLTKLERAYGLTRDKEYTLMPDGRIHQNST